MTDLLDVLHELEAGLASPQRRRYLRELLVSSDLEGKSDSGNVDSEWCAAAQAASMEVDGRQDLACYTHPVKRPCRHSDRVAGRL